MAAASTLCVLCVCGCMWVSAGVDVFRLNFSHGTHNEGLGGVIRDIFSVHNLWTVAIEMAIVGPLLWLTERYRRRAD